MNSIVGKSTGIALLMAAAMLAALFAMGVFSATGVGAHEDPTSDSTHDDAAVHLTAGTLDITGGSDPAIVDDNVGYTVTVEAGVTALSFTPTSAESNAKFESTPDDANEDNGQMSLT